MLIDVANEIATQLKTTGKVTRGRLESYPAGCQELAESSVCPNQPARWWRRLKAVLPDRPASKPATSSSSSTARRSILPNLPRLVGSTKPGAKRLCADAQQGDARATLVVGEMQDTAPTAQRPQPRRAPGGKPAEPVSRFGMTLSEPTAEQRNQLKITGGILVEDAQGIAARAGIRRGDIILAVNNQDVKTLEQFGQMMEKFEKGRVVALLVRRGANALYIPFRIE